MQYYHYFLALHIVSAVIWLAIIPADRVLKKYIFGSGSAGRRKIISAWLKILNITGIAGMTGILISGILMVSVNPGFGYFQADANHWLTAKQILMIVIIVLTAFFIIPAGKRLRQLLGSDEESSEELNEEALRSLSLIAKMAQIVSGLILINFIFGLFYSVLRMF